MAQVVRGPCLLSLLLLPCNLVTMGAPMSSFSVADPAQAFLSQDDYTAVSFWIISIAMIATTVFLLAEASSVVGHWKTSVHVGALVTLVAAVHYMYMREYWVAVHASPIVYRYIDWTITVPLQMIEFNLIIKAAGGKIGAGFLEALDWHCSHAFLRLFRRDPQGQHGPVHDGLRLRLVRLGIHSLRDLRGRVRAGLPPGRSRQGGLWIDEADRVCGLEHLPCRLFLWHHLLGRVCSGFERHLQHCRLCEQDRFRAVLLVLRQERQRESGSLGLISDRNSNPDVFSPLSRGATFRIFLIPFCHQGLCKLRLLSASS